MLPTTKAKTITANGRLYTVILGTPALAVPDQDASVLSANGWINAAGVQSVGSGTTANRPTVSLVAGNVYNDTTLGYNVVWDGATWRHHSTGIAA